MINSTSCVAVPSCWAISSREEPALAVAPTDTGSGNPEARGTSATLK